ECSESERQQDERGHDRSAGELPVLAPSARRVSNTGLPASGYAYFRGETNQVLDFTPGRQTTGINFQMAPFKKGRLRAFGTAEGLADDTVIRASLGRDGRIWFGTLNGASRYDGRRFSNLTVE